MTLDIEIKGEERERILSVLPEELIAWKIGRPICGVLHSVYYFHRWKEGLNVAVTPSYDLESELQETFGIYAYAKREVAEEVYKYYNKYNVIAAPFVIFPVHINKSDIKRVGYECHLPIDGEKAFTLVATQVIFHSSEVTLDLTEEPLCISTDANSAAPDGPQQHPSRSPVDSAAPSTSR